jgi:hypothetical protein
VLSNTEGPVPITDELRIDGPGADMLQIIGFLGQIFRVEGSAEATIDDVTLGQARAEGAAGGAIDNAGNLTLDSVLITGATSLASGGAGGKGGAIANTGTLLITASTLRGNGAAAANGPDGGRGGALFNSGTATIEGSTLSANNAAGGQSYNGHPGTAEGGAIANTGTLTITDSTLAKNEARGGFARTSATAGSPCGARPCATTRRSATAGRSRARPSVAASRTATPRRC